MDTTHLVYLESGLARERARLAAATSPGERALRAAWVAQGEREVAGERAFLGMTLDEPLGDMSLDDIFAELEGLEEP